MKVLVQLPCFLFSHTPQTFFQIINYLIPFSLNKYSNTGVAWRLEKLYSDRKVWICQICYENLGGGTEWIHDDLHQSALEQNIVLSLAPVLQLRIVCNPFSPVVTIKDLLKFINKQLPFTFAGLYWFTFVTKTMISPHLTILNSNYWITIWSSQLNVLGIHLRVVGGRGRGVVAWNNLEWDLPLITSINNQGFHVKANVFPVSWTPFVTALQLIETLERGGNAPGLKWPWLRRHMHSSPQKTRKAQAFQRQLSLASESAG